MSWILTHLMIGVAFIALYDYASSRLETEKKFTNRERLIVVLFWPIAIIMLIWSFIQVLRDGSN